jgi:integrase
MGRRNKGPRLELNDRGVWEIRWTDENSRSKRVSTRSTDRQEANRYFAGFLLEMQREADKQMTVGAIIDIYLAEHVDGGKVVDKVRQRNIAKNLMPVFDDVLPDQVTPKLVAEYSRRRRDGSVGKRRALSSGTLRRELNMLKAALNYAATTRRIPSTDVPHIPLPEAPGARDLWLTEKESALYLRIADKHGSERGRLFAWIALHTASRRAAIERLTWEQVDLDADLIHFNPPGRAQSAKRRVPVPISDELHAVLSAEKVREGFVLGHPGSITRAVEAINRRAYAATHNDKFLKVSPHTLRHTWATQAARAGRELYEIAGVLGDTLATVQRVYIHHCPDHLRGAVNFRAESRAPRGGTAPLGVSDDRQQPTM